MEKEKRFMKLVLRILLAIWGDLVTHNNSNKQNTQLQEPHRGHLHSEAFKFIEEGGDE